MIEEINNTKIHILGTDYIIFEKTSEEDKVLEDAAGYCDNTSKIIVISKKKGDLDNWEFYANKLLRHEIIHAFLNESGLQENFEHKNFGQDETMVDWFACQFPKIKKVFEKLDILE